MVTLVNPIEQAAVERNWMEGMPSQVRVHVFGDKQFVNPKDEEFGSDWQRAVCAHITSHAGDDVLEAFWRSKGMICARKTINQRRSNLTTNMKVLFKSKNMYGVLCGMACSCDKTIHSDCCSFYSLFLLIHTP